MAILWVGLLVGLYVAPIVWVLQSELRFEQPRK